MLYRKDSGKPFLTQSRYLKKVRWYWWISRKTPSKGFQYTVLGNSWDWFLLSFCWIWFCRVLLFYYNCRKIAVFQEALISSRHGWVMEFLTSLGRNHPLALPQRGAWVSSAAASVSLHPALIIFVFNAFCCTSAETDLEFLSRDGSVHPNALALGFVFSPRVLLPGSARRQTMQNLSAWFWGTQALYQICCHRLLAMVPGENLPH